MISASIMCADLLNLEGEIKRLEQEDVDYIHIDIMDGKFVDNFAIQLEDLSFLRGITNIPFDYHLMVYNPEKIIELLPIQESDIVTFHFESTFNHKKIINRLREKNVGVGIAINPTTSVNKISIFIRDIDLILIMLVNPGFKGAPIIESALKKVKEVDILCSELGYNEKIISVDGHVSFENIPNMKSDGANMFVGGTTCLFRKDMSYSECIKKIKDLIYEEKVYEYSI